MIFLCFSFALNQKYRPSKFCPLMAAKSGQNKPFRYVAQNLLSQRKIIRKLHRVKEKGLLMQYHSIIIENLPKRMHNKYLKIAYDIRESFTAHFKIIISQKFKTQ